MDTDLCLPFLHACAPQPLLISKLYIPGKARVRSADSYLVAGEGSNIELQCLFYSLWNFVLVPQQARTYAAGAGLRE